MDRHAFLRWGFDLKRVLLWAVMAMLLGGYALIISVQYGIVASALVICAAIGVVVFQEWFFRRRTLEKIERILLARRFPVNVEVSGAHITSAKVDAWLIFRGNPKALAIDLTNRLLWALFDERKIHALLPRAVSSFDLRDEVAFGGKRRRFLELRSPEEPPMRFRILDGDESHFRAVMTQLLRLEGKDRH